jgi:hypothetical protein
MKQTCSDLPLNNILNPSSSQHALHQCIILKYCSHYYFRAGTITENKRPLCCTPCKRILLVYTLPAVQKGVAFVIMWGR